MNFLENKKTQLEQLSQSMQAISKRIDGGIDDYFQHLRKTCMALARIVHEGQTDLAGAPYIRHVTRIAEKGSNVLMYCAGLLHDIIEDGAYLGVTKEFLLEKMKFPAILVDLIDTVSRRKGESQSVYFARILESYCASKLKRDDSADNADISRFAAPDDKDFERCRKYLLKVFNINNHAVFYQEGQFDYINELIALAGITPMIVNAQTSRMRSNEGMVLASYYFGYAENRSRCYTLKLISYTDEKTNTIKVKVITYPSNRLYADLGLYKPRGMSLSFKDLGDALDYVAEINKRIAECGVMHCTNAMGVESMATASSATTGVEDTFIHQINQTYF